MYCSVEVYHRKKRWGLLIFSVLLISIVMSSVLLIIQISSGLKLPGINTTVYSENKVIEKNDIYKNFVFLGNKFTKTQKAQNIAVVHSLLNNNNNNDNQGIKSVVNDNNEVKKPEQKPEKIAFLTFDDGPSHSITPQILKILDEQDIKATFFVLGEMCSLFPDILKKEQEKGHLICNHTYSHEYKKIYASKEAFIDEIKQCEETIVSILGSDWDSNNFVRFPGGSFEKKFDPFKAELKKQGYVSFDWNALSGDAEGVNVPVKKLMKNIADSTENNNNALILMHDSAGKETTVKALPDIIKYLKDKGYVFETLRDYPQN